MPPAARVGDTTVHGGTVVGPGVATVLVGGMPVAVTGDIHACSIPPPSHVPVTPFTGGSTTVQAGGRGLLRVGDSCGCGASVAVGNLTVLVG